MALAPTYFERIDEHRFRPTEHVGGAWTPSEQHISPLNGLIVHAVETDRPDDGLAIARISVDILGTLSLDDFDLHTEVIRPGRTIELVEATVTSGGRTAVRARLWRLATYPTVSVADGQPAPIPGRDGLGLWPLSDVWPGGYIASVDVRPTSPPTPGRTTAWVSTEVALLGDEPVSTLARWIGLVDTANGIAVRQAPTEWMFANVDLTIHLYRQPVGPDIGLDTTVIFGPEGQGLTLSTLHDLDGPVGQAAQMLTVRPMG